MHVCVCLCVTGTRGREERRRRRRRRKEVEEHEASQASGRSTGRRRRRRRTDEQTTCLFIGRVRTGWPGETWAAGGGRAADGRRPLRGGVIQRAERHALAVRPALRPRRPGVD